jgi:hypothetical protein
VIATWESYAKEQERVRFLAHNRAGYFIRQCGQPGETPGEATRNLEMAQLYTALLPLRQTQGRRINAGDFWNKIFIPQLQYRRSVKNRVADSRTSQSAKPGKRWAAAPPKSAN